MTLRIDETLFNEAERYILKLLGNYGPDYGLQLPEGKMTDCAVDLARRGFVEHIDGYYALTDAGRSQLRSNWP